MYPASTPDWLTGFILHHVCMHTLYHATLSLCVLAWRNKPFPWEMSLPEFFLASRNLRNVLDRVLLSITLIFSPSHRLWREKGCVIPTLEVWWPTSFAEPSIKGWCGSSCGQNDQEFQDGDNSALNQTQGPFWAWGACVSRPCSSVRARAQSVFTGSPLKRAVFITINSFFSVIIM